MIDLSGVLFQEIIMLIIIIVGVAFIFIEIQLRKILKDERKFGARVKKDESILYSAEKSLLSEIKGLRGALENLKGVDKIKRDKK